jgi:hypothetical protein
LFFAIFILAMSLDALFTGDSTLKEKAQPYGT